MASVLIIKPCPFCKKEYQKMFPADDREFLITGICPTCWDLTFGGED